ncbi:transposase [Nonomuraea phyllanthi]|uniref:transposase n=1 Tax=Nonomuraea phyllanthi TaxID=2219224 RepID=UPI0037C59E77
MASVVVTRRHDLTDAQWAALEPHLPAASGKGRPPKWSRRQLIDGIRWRIRTGAPWRDVPACYGHWFTVYGLFRRWQREGIWARILAALQACADAAGKIDWTVSALPAKMDRGSKQVQNSVLRVGKETSLRGSKRTGSRDP